MSVPKRKAEPFFFYFSALILAVVVGGFGINAAINFDELPPISSIVIVHGVLMLAWYILVVVQAGLIMQLKHSLHMTLGKSSIALAIGIVISGTIMTLESYARSGRVDIVTVNLFITINFIILYGLALLNRKNGIYHKRLIAYASIAMLLPALGRVAQAAHVNPFITLPMLLLFIAIPIVYDIRTLKKVHRTTLLGSVLIILGIAFTVGLLESSAWNTFLENTLG